MKSLMSRYLAFPRAGRWLVLLCVVVGAYFLVVDPVLLKTNQLNDAADATADALAREKAIADDWAGPGRPLSAARDAFGEPLLPGADAQRKQALYTRVNQILDKHRVRPEISERTSTVRDDRTEILREGADRIDRLTLDLTFEADPATVIAVLSELEQAPEVTAVARVQMRRVETGRTGGGGGGGGAGGGGHRVRAVLSPETWVRVSAVSGTGGRS